MADALRDFDLRQRLGFGLTNYCERKARGEFRFLELTPQLPGSNTLYSRSKVDRWLAGELPQSETRPRRSFPHAVPQPAKEKRRPGRPRKSGIPPLAQVS